MNEILLPWTFRYIEMVFLRKPPFASHETIGSRRVPRHFSEIFPSRIRNVDDRASEKFIRHLPQL